MNKGRTSYIPNAKAKTSLAWPIITLISFLIILILLVLLVFSHLDSINNIINVAQIEKKINDLNYEYENSLVETTKVTESLRILKNDLVSLQETEGTKLNFYNHMKTLNEIKTSFPQKIYQSFNTRNIMKDNEKNIFISDSGQVCIRMDYLFNKDQTKINKNTSDFFKVLAKKIYEILSDEVYGRFIECINIDTYTLSNDLNEIELSIIRGEAFKQKLFDSYQELDSEYSSRVLVRSFENNNSLNDKSDSTKDSRIEITLTISNDSILGGIKNFIEIPSTPVENKK